MVQTIKFSEMTDGGDLANDDKVPGLLAGGNVLFNNPWTFLADGATGDRPVPTPAIYYRLRFNTTLTVYEYYDPLSALWIELSGSGMGTVNPGTANDIGFYAANGTAISPVASNANAVLVSNGSQVPSMSTTLPVGLSIPGAIITASTAALLSGSVVAAPVAGIDLTNKTYVDSLFSSGVTAIVGTTNQVFANGVAATPETGVVTLSLPQDIALGSTPTFAGLTLTSIPLGATSGGTAQSTYTLGDTLYSSAANTLSKLSGNITGVKQYLSQTGTGVVSAAPAWATISGGDITGAALTKVDDTNVTLTLGGTPATALLRTTSLTLGWTGQLGLTRGGTNASLTASNGGLVYSTATELAILAGTVTAGQIPRSGSSSAPSWSTSTYPATNAINTILYASSANTMAALATVNRASLSTDSTGVPTWLALTDGQLVIGSTAGSPAAASLTAGAGISITPGSNSISIAATSGSGSPLTTKGDIYTFSTVNDRLAVGITNGQMLQVNSATSTGLAWSTATFPTTATSTGTILRANGTNWVPSTATFADTYAASTLLYSNGANTVTGLATANRAVLTTTTTGVPVMTALATDGQLIIGSTAGAPAAATLTAGAGISITSGSNSISISATGSGTVATIAGTSQAGAVNTAYIALNAGQTTLTLPATYAVGDDITLIGSTANTGGWIVTASTGDTIRVNNSTTSSGGTVTSSAVAGQTIELMCDVANTSWVMVSTSSVILTTA